MRIDYAWPMPSEPGANVIMIIRHAEKPKGELKGVTIEGVEDEDSLIPRGWQRAGALVDLFAPQVGPIREGLYEPDLLIAPEYAKHDADRRTHETITPLSERLGLEVTDPYAEEHEPELARFVSEQTTASVVLICWEHGRIPSIGEHISKVVDPQYIPEEWPSARFDLIWMFLREEGKRSFSVFSQLLLPGDVHPPQP
jgi:hypothetical protein